MSEAATATIDGGCLCGAVRWRARGRVLSVTHCHCSMCRRASGAPVLTWASFAADDFALTSGALARYDSSPEAWRGFCAACGSQISFGYRSRPDLIYLTVGGFDDPQAVVPERHIWTDDRLLWLELSDTLPRHPGDTPPAESDRT